MTLAKALSNIIVLGPTKRRNINNQEIEHNNIITVVACNKIISFEVQV